MMGRALLIATSLCVIVSSYLSAEAFDTFEPSVIQIGPEPGSGSKVARRSIAIINNDFVLDGKPTRIISGSLHYFRLPAEYWRDRLRKLKAAGLNSVATYVEWSYHEPEEGQYLFEGDRDVAKFIRMAAEEGLYVLLRVGPYICAERDLGGFPYWLLGKYPNISLRSTDKDYIAESGKWLDKFFEQTSSLLYGNGGPIILVQVENEYGSYGNNMNYRVQVRNMLQNHVGTNALLYTTDGNAISFFRNGAVPNTLTTIDFGPHSNVQQSFEELRKFMPSGPLMNSEYYTGWLTHWGERLAVVKPEDVAKTLGDIISYGANVNFYMFFGGTNFEYTAGANYFGTFQPDITSYDYDAPISEAGDLTPKYHLIRQKLKENNFVNESIEVPQNSPKGDYGPVNLTATVNLLSPEGRSQLGKKYPDVTGPNLPTFEHLRQRAGLMLYETTLTEADDLLHIKTPRDMIFVFVDGEFRGRISRIHKIYSIPLSAKNGSVLSLLVEPLGRINFGRFIHDFKGILSQVEFKSKVLDGKWTVTGFPLETFDTSPVNNPNLKTPAFYEGYFTLPEGKEPLDTFVDTTGWGKGYIWVNGHNLGRYWPTAGPQITLYLPGVWLKPAPERNHIRILELNRPPPVLAMDLIDYPILNRTGNINWWRIQPKVLKPNNVTFV
ncbi:unnamed protein product [Spodoptera littoralis]|uniref:Beta-galactosidase n=1 Tax=Spodoptera littoralis TaxID=7109 RepID=A0A9P0NAU5_SPOLI|nr:unnamed protein product [Spodoptera littoralis]CAH1646106.1 unnamed protein product [Spodoptera littoralis]